MRVAEDAGAFRRYPRKSGESAGIRCGYGLLVYSEIR